MDYTKLEKSAVEYAEYKIKDSLLSLLSDMSEQPENDIDYELPASVKAIKEEIEQLYLELEDVIDSEREERNGYIEKLSELRKQVIATALQINRYTCCCNQLGDYLSNIYKLNDVAKISEDFALSNSSVAKSVYNYASNIKNDSFEMFNTAKIMSALPLRMARQKYADYIANSTKALIKNLPSEFRASAVKRLKDMFYAPLDNSLKADYPLMYEMINELYSIDKSEFNNDDLENYLGNIDDNNEQLHQAFELLGIYYNDVNYLHNVAAFCVDNEFIFGGEPVIKDLFYLMSNIIKEKDTSLIDTLNEQVVDQIEDRFNLMHEKEEALKNAVARLKLDELPETLQVSLSVCSTVDNYYFSELDTAIMNFAAVEDDDKLIDELVNYTNDSIADLPKERQKFIKQKFLTNIPCLYTPDKLSEYTQYSLDGINNKAVSLVAYGDVLHLTDADNDDECGCGHEHHHHDDNCGCGHEHHHHDNCDCGHEHHHHDNCGCGHEHHHHDNCSCSHEHNH